MVFISLRHHIRWSTASCMNGALPNQFSLSMVRQLQALGLINGVNVGGHCLLAAPFNDQDFFLWGDSALL